jgi:transcriptional regulator with XRE-family HTH domain
MMVTYTFDGKQFSHDLTRWLQFKRYTLRDACAETGVNISVLSRLTHGATPELGNFATLCKAMNVPMDDYFEERQPVVDTKENE